MNALDFAIQQMERRPYTAIISQTRFGAHRKIRRGLSSIAYDLRRLGKHVEDGASLSCLLDIASRAYAGERERGRAGHWSHDYNRLLALRETVLALRYLRRFGAVLAEREAA